MTLKQRIAELEEQVEQLEACCDNKTQEARYRNVEVRLLSEQLTRVKDSLPWFAFKARRLAEL